MLAQIGGAEALRELPEQDESMQKRVSPRIGKAQTRGALAAGSDRAVDSLEGILAENAIVAEAFDLEQLAIGCKPDRTQLQEIREPFAHCEVIAVVDRCLGGCGPVLLMILLDAR